MNSLRLSRARWILPMLLVLAVVGVLVGQQEADALPLRDDRYFCFHNGNMYTVVTLGPGESEPSCPDFEPTYKSTWDEQDGYSCGGVDGAPPCVKDRHIDCEYTSSPGGI